MICHPLCGGVRAPSQFYVTRSFRLKVVLKIPMYIKVKSLIYREILFFIKINLCSCMIDVSIPILASEISLSGG